MGFWDYANALKLDYGDGNQLCDYNRICYIFYFKWVDFFVYGL